jgi:uncharacterized delta-60 repeat protein
MPKSGFTHELLEPRRLLTTLGTLDPSFSRDGQAYAGFDQDSNGESVAVQSNGKILVGGDTQIDTGDGFAAARFNADGSGDATFGSGTGVVGFNPFAQLNSGNTVIAPQFVNSAAAGIAVGPSGEIYLAGEANGEIIGSTDPNDVRDYAVLVALHPDGSFDESFGTHGVVWEDFGQTGDSEFNALTVDSSGDIVAVGESNGEAVVARFTSTGALDTNFHGTGFNRFSFSGEEDAKLTALTLGSDGSIYVAGYAGPDSGLTDPGGQIDFEQADIAVAKLTSAGILDTGFGPNDNGRFTVNGGIALGQKLGRGDSANSIFLDNKGRLVVGGTIDDDVTSDGEFTQNFAILRYDTFGDADPAWGKNGIELFQFPGTGDQQLGAVAAYGSARYLIAGNTGDDPDAGTDGDFFLEAVSSKNAKLDTTFGSKGYTGFKRDNVATSIAVAKDGSIFLSAGTGPVITEGEQGEPLLAGVVKLRGEAGAISGVVINDANANGINDPTDPRLPNAELYLDFNSDGQLDAGEPTAFTNKNGQFTFTDVGPGTYKLRPVLTGLRVTAPSAGFRTVTVVSDHTTASQNFYLTSRTFISGIVFRDDNGDGIYEPDDDENPLADFSVLLDLNGNGTADAGEPILTSDVNGNFAVRTLKAGTYHFVLLPPQGWSITTSADLTVTVKPGQIVKTLAFGAVPTGD